MVKGVPSIGMGLFFWFWRQGTQRGTSVCPNRKRADNRSAPKEPKTAFQSFHPGGRVFRLTPVNHPRKEDIYMKKSESSKVKPISIRYTCAPNGDQVGLSHYLMADAKKAK